MLEWFDSPCHVTIRRWDGAHRKEEVWKVNGEVEGSQEWKVAGREDISRKVAEGGERRKVDGVYLVEQRMKFDISVFSY